MNNLSKLQQWLIDNDLDAFIFFRTDEFLSEYIAPYAERLKWISNFSGSAGKAVIKQTSATIFVDGRYTIQAHEEVDLNSFSIEHLYDFPDWLKNNLHNKLKIGLDPHLHSKKDLELIEKIIDETDTEIKFLNDNPIDQLWENQPARPRSKAFQHALQYSGISAEKKILQIKSIIKSKQCDYYIISTLDSIAWLLNIRGNDILYTPLNLAYAIITQEKKIELFIDEEKIQDIKSKISEFSNPHPLKSIESFIKDLPSNTTIGLDKIRTPFIFENICREKSLKFKYFEDPCIYPKAQKNETELQGACLANTRDGISITKFLYWLKNEIRIDDTDEIIAAEKLFTLRKNNDLFYSLSFETISAADQHSALPHYRVTKESNLRFKKNSIYLVDSGAQYLDGTTDITRTIIFGSPTKEQKDRFTRVLKGHIAIANCVFEEGIQGSLLDPLARKSLNNIGCDYDHGTGHGIGSFLSVHEGPQRIAKSTGLSDGKIKEGMIISNEPGFYKKGEYGIRIENLVIAKKKSHSQLEFEVISWAPIDVELIENSLLTFEEKEWVNWYHQEVYNKLAGQLDRKEKSWLNKVTRPIG